MPVPLKEIVRGEPGAVLVIERLPDAPPADAGENFALNDVFCPAVRVTGTDKPDMLNPVPDTLAAVIMTLAVPEFVKVTGTVALLPTSKLPKLIVDGLAERAACVPVPVSATVGSEELLVTVMVPEAFPVTVGSKTAEKVVLWPAVRVTGTPMPVTLKPAPVALTCVTVALVLPVFVIVTV